MWMYLQEGKSAKLGRVFESGFFRLLFPTRHHSLQEVWYWQVFVSLLLPLLCFFSDLWSHFACSPLGFPVPRFQLLQMYSQFHCHIQHRESLRVPCWDSEHKGRWKVQQRFPKVPSSNTGAHSNSKADLFVPRQSIEKIRIYF